MKIDVGKFYFIKDEFFEIVNDKELTKNKENGIKRPCYYCFKSKEIECKYVKNKVEITVSNRLQEEIIFKVNRVLNLYKNGMKNIVFPNIDIIY